MKSFQPALAGVSALVMLLCAAPVCAQNFVSLYFENDMFLDTDQSYTDGVRVSWTHRLEQNAKPWWEPSFLRNRFFLDCMNDSDKCWHRYSSWSFGQNMYTPQDITVSDLIEDDRPYGGWLYLGLSETFVRQRTLDQPTMSHTVELAAGMIGPASLGEPTQKFVHECISPVSPEPMGWSHQLDNELGIVLGYGGQIRAFEHINLDGIRLFDVAPRWDVVAGNIFTYAGGGAMARLGWNLGDDFGLDRVEPVALLIPRGPNFEVYLFGGLAGRAVAHNIFVDGSLIRDSKQSVSAEHFVADIEVGVFARFKKIAASGRWVRRTPEFEERRIYQEYAAFNLTFQYGN